MSNRDKLAGLQHIVEFTVAIIGLGGYLWWVTHPKVYHECNCK